MTEPAPPSFSAPALAQFSDDMGEADPRTGFATSPSSPGISVQLHGDPVEARPGLVSHLSAPVTQTYQSPIRQHKRTPSQHREVKETLNARSEYTSDDQDGQSHHKVNQYTIKEEIGRGSYGAVHLATDQYGHEYAVKEFSKARLRRRAQSNILRHGPRRPGPIRPPMTPRLGVRNGAETADALFLIREEIAIMKKLNHPNLVQLIEVLDDPEEDSLYMVLEMCKKGVVMKVGLGESAEPYDLECCRCWFRDLVLGIEYLHAQGVVHRDIKPDNLLLTNDDVLKIVDFGVSEMFEKADNMRTAKSAGSPAFLPPELCVAKHGDVSGKACDIWSMGVSLYCLRYGKIPFERTGVMDMYDAIKTDEAELPEDEDEGFRDLMHKILEKDPDKRITMAQLREHTWVTKNGTDPLLSADENCANLVGPPNALEVNHAFTRRMSHLLCVMKAISKFKALLHSRAGTPRTDSSPAPATEDDDDAATPRPSATTTSADDRMQGLSDEDKENAEHATRLIEERINFLRKSTSHTGSGNKGQHHHYHDHAAAATHDDTDDTTDQPPPFLGIGTGGRDDFAVASPHASDGTGIVSDSPTAVDFNVYDKAYETEIKRIRSQSGRARTYPTKHLRERDHYKMERAAADGSQSSQPTTPLPAKEVAGESPGNISPSDDVRRAHRFAETVTRAVNESRSRERSPGR